VALLFLYQEIASSTTGNSDRFFAGIFGLSKQISIFLKRMRKTTKTIAFITLGAQT
jgi:hypothetical protein